MPILATLFMACTSGPVGLDDPDTTAPTHDSATTDSDDTADSGDTDVTVPWPPVLTSIDPALGDTLGGVTVTVTGTALLGASSLTLGGADCTDLVATDTVATCTAPALAAGPADVSITTPGGGATLVSAYEAWSPVQIDGARVYTSSAGFTLDEEPGPIWTWEQIASEGPWHPRDGAGLVWFADKLWMLGGWYGYTVPEWNDQTTTNEVWSSDDLGATWVQELPHDAAPPTSGAGARWLARHTAGVLTHTHDGVPYIYMIGGDPWPVVNDVWRSSDGVTWEEVTADAEWGGRYLHMVGSYDGDLYVMGGQTDLNDPSTCMSDVWRSEDGGYTWVQLDDAPWAARGMAYNLAEHDGKLWLMGGGTYDDAPRTFYNDVWSFDGATWTEVSPNGVAPWLEREYHNTYAAEGELWVSSGYGSDGLNHNDFWHSADGVTWAEVADTPMAAGHADGIAVTPYGVVHASGNAMDTEVYRMVAGEGAVASAWADQGADELDLVAPQPENRVVVMVDAFGDEDGVWLDGMSAFLQLDAWDPLPAGHSVFWVGRTEKQVAWWDNINPSMTVVGDVNGPSRVQAGYSADQIELVVTEPVMGAWTDGHVLRGSGQTDGQVRLVGFTHDVDGTVVAFIDGAQEGDPAMTTYDPDWTGWDLVGAGFSTGSRAQVMLGLVVVVPAIVTDEELAKLATFSRKWGTSAR